MKRYVKHLIYTAIILTGFNVNAAEYKVDNKGAHASINFKIKHLGYSWLTGRFNNFDGDFTYDKEHIEDSEIRINIDVGSIDTNHSERDKHLRSKDFLNVSKFSEAKFVSSNFLANNEGGFDVLGKLTLNGVSKDIIIKAEKIGEGKDPWGGYRVGFTGKTSLKLKDFNIEKDLGEASAYVDLELNIEGIRN